MDRRRQNPARMAQSILRKRTVVAIKSVVANLSHFSARLAEECLIAEGRYDPEDLSKTKEVNAAILYNDCMTVVQISPKKLPTVLDILEELPQLREAVLEMKKEGECSFKVILYMLTTSVYFSI